jgi:hypothetical protein
VIAAAAITYLVMAMNWHDQLTIPGNVVIDGLATSSGPRTARVLVQDDAGVHLDVHGTAVTLAHARVGSAPGQLQITPGILTVLQAVDPLYLILIASVILCVIPIQAARWWLLLRARGIAPGPLSTLRLHLVGCFWNCLFPGLTGGDAVKAWQVAQVSGRVTDAIMSVLVDRVLGLLALFLLAALAGLAFSGSASHNLLATRVWLALALLAPALAAWLSPSVSRLSGVDHVLAWAARRPRLEPIITAVIAYRRHPVALLAGFACSLVGHVLMIGGCILAGRTLGITTSVSEMFMLLSLVFLVGAVPISLFGLGVMEVAAVTLFGSLASPNQVISMLVIYRCVVICCALPGGALIIGGTRWRGQTRAPAPKTVP